MSVALSTVQEKGLSPRNVKRQSVRINPIDFDSSIAVGIDLPFGSPTSGDYGTITSGSANEIPEIQKDQAISTNRKQAAFSILTTRRRTRRQPTFET